MPFQGCIRIGILHLILQIVGFTDFRGANPEDAKYLMKYSDFSKQFQIDSQLHVRTNKTALKHAKSSSNPREDQIRASNGDQVSDKLPIDHNGPVIAVMELPPKKIL